MSVMYTKKDFNEKKKFAEKSICIALHVYLYVTELKKKTLYQPILYHNVLILY